MESLRKKFFIGSTLLLGILSQNSNAWEINNSTRVEISLTGIYQHAIFSSSAEGNVGAGLAVLETALEYEPTENILLHTSVGYSTGNGLNKIFEEKEFSLVPYDGETEQELKNINHSGRKYLETFYSQFTTHFSENLKFISVYGLIDATEYLDINEYANDENEQFMNSAFVNNPLADILSYSLGVVWKWEYKFTSLTALYTNLKNDEGNNYNYYALQTSLELFNRTRFHLYYWRTDKKFLSYTGKNDYKEGIGLSASAKILKNLGSFLRTSLNTHTDTGDFKNFISGGITLSNILFHEDNLAFALGYLKGNKKISEIIETHVLEGYYKIPIWKKLELTFDIQYQKDIKETEEISAIILGTRASVSF